MLLTLLLGLAYRGYMRLCSIMIHRIRPTWPLAQWQIVMSLFVRGRTTIGITIAAVLLVLHAGVPIAWLSGIHA